MFSYRELFDVVTRAASYSGIPLKSSDARRAALLCVGLPRDSVLSILNSELGRLEMRKSNWDGSIA